MWIVDTQSDIEWKINANRQPAQIHRYTVILWIPIFFLCKLLRFSILQQINTTGSLCVGIRGAFVVVYIATCENSFCGTTRWVYFRTYYLLWFIYFYFQLYGMSSDKTNKNNWFVCISEKKHAANPIWHFTICGLGLGCTKSTSLGPAFTPLCYWIAVEHRCRCKFTPRVSTTKF